MKLFDPNLKFYKGNTHAHTTNSDGRVTPEESMKWYRDAGYDFLALTDHWFVGKEQRWENMLVIPGVEYDFNFPTQVLHLVALYQNAKDGDGISRGITHEEVIKRVNEAGGVAIAAHPAWSLNTADFLCSLSGVNIAEVYNTVSGEPFNGPRANSEGILDVAGANGKLFNLVAADDSHFYQGEQGVSFTMVQAEELTVIAILDALKKGRFYASQGPEFKNIEIEGNEVLIETSPVSRITVCSNRYYVRERCVEGKDLTSRTYQILPGEKYIRVQITDAQGKKAWSSPIALS